MQEWESISHKDYRELQRLQVEALNYATKHLVPFHPFYRQIIGLHRHFSTVKDLQKLPFTSKLDLLPTEENPAKSRDFILQPNQDSIKKYYPKSKLLKLLIRKILHGVDIGTSIKKEFKPIQIHFTTGRSTAQIPYFYTQDDLEKLGSTGLRLIKTIGASPDSIVINAFPFAPHLAFWLAYHATKNGQILSLDTGGGKILGTQKIIDAVERLKATILICMPGYGYHLIREAVAQTKDFSSLQYVVLGGERVNDGYREKMKLMLNSIGAKKTKILATYAFTEGKTAWVQCHEKSGYHLYPDLELIELIDEAGQSVPEGRPGEIVYTSLGWRGSIVMRYRTGDICNGLFYSTPCQYCGRTVPRLGSVIERKFDNVSLNLTKVKGELINLAAFSATLSRIPEVQEWQVEITKKNNDPHDLDELLLHVSLDDSGQEKKLIPIIEERIRNEIGLLPRIIIHSLDELVNMLGLENELKEKRVVDKRK